MRRFRSARRFALLAAIVTFLTLVGSTVAYAVWSSSAGVTSGASTATVALTQSAATPSALAFTYKSSALVTAAPVTLVNTGSRSATYSLSILASASTSTTLPAAITARVAPVAHAPACTSSASLASPTTGALSQSTALVATGTFAAGASVVLCVQTSMTAASVSTFAEKKTTLTLSSTTTAGTWTRAAVSTLVVEQKVASALLFYTDPSARYNILNANSCVSVPNSADPRLARSGVCDFNNLGQFRIVAATTGNNFYISAARNDSTQPAAPRWSLSSATADIATATAADAAAQRWSVQQRGDNLYRLVNEAFGTCAVVSSSEIWSGGGYLLRGATCNDASAAQGFTFAQVSSPVPLAPLAVTCSGNGWYYIDLSWPTASGYEAEIDYRVYINGVFAKNALDGYWTHAQFDGTLPIATFGSGTVSVLVTQSIAGSGWSTTATGSIYIEPGTNRVLCS